MSLAIEEAMMGLREGGIPVGSVLIRNDRVIGRGHNMRIQRNDPTAHAEIECLRNAGRIGNYSDTVLFSTLMPCHLCAGAIIQFKIRTVVVGEDLNFDGEKELLQSRGVTVIDLDSKECIQLMADFIRDNPKLWNEDIGTL
jgi:cytosine deaminase